MSVGFGMWCSCQCFVGRTILQVCGTGWLNKNGWKLLEGCRVAGLLLTGDPVLFPSLRGHARSQVCEYRFRFHMTCRRTRQLSATAACGIKDDTLNARSFCLSGCCEVMPDLAVFIPSGLEFHFEESFIGFL